MPPANGGRLWVGESRQWDGAATALALARDGFDVAVFDAMLAADESEFQVALEQHQPDVVVLFEDNFNFLSKMCLTRMREAALTMTAIGIKIMRPE